MLVLSLNDVRSIAHRHGYKEIQHNTTSKVLSFRGGANDSICVNVYYNNNNNNDNKTFSNPKTNPQQFFFEHRKIMEDFDQLESIFQDPKKKITPTTNIPMQPPNKTTTTTTITDDNNGGCGGILHKLYGIILEPTCGCGGSDGGSNSSSGISPGCGFKVCPYQEKTEEFNNGAADMLDSKNKDVVFKHLMINAIEI